LTRKVCEPWPVEYYQRKNRPDCPYSNPAIPNNIGLRKATGDIVILQNAENVHVSERAILDLIAPVEADAATTTFGSVLALRENGDPQSWYIHPTKNPRPLFFIQAIRREPVEWMRGFDEDFLFYGWDDDDFAQRLACMGLKFKFTDVLFHHHWHPHSSGIDFKTCQELFKQKSVDMSAGRIGPQRNLGREWGDINS
jgi:GT2 family glycosyltransferase